MVEYRIPAVDGQWYARRARKGDDKAWDILAGPMTSLRSTLQELESERVKPEVGDTIGQIIDGVFYLTLIADQASWLWQPVARPRQTPFDATKEELRT